MKSIETIVEEGKNLKNAFLTNDLEKILLRYNEKELSFNEALFELDRAFYNAVYGGVYEALPLEMYCKDRIEM